MRIIIKNCILISMCAEREIIEKNIDIMIENKKIVNIGKNIETSLNDKIIDASNKVVMPGLINTHTHTAMSIFRETLEGYNLQDWLSKKIWPMEDKLNEEDSYYASYLSFLEMIKTGTTTANDLYFLSEGTIKAMLETGIRFQTTRTLMNIEGEETGKRRINELENLIEKYLDKNEKLSFSIGIHGLYTCNEKYINSCIELARKYELPIHMHFCENTTEVLEINKIYGKTPVEILKEKFLDKKIVLAHAVKVSENEIDSIKNMNISIAHCPISNLKLGCGIAKVDCMLQKGINVSLGTDGQGTGSNLDMFETMKFTALLQKGITENPEKLSSYEILKMATINGAKALGLEDKIGSIEIGKFADLIIIDIDDIKAKPLNNLISELIYNIKGDNVITTIVNGDILMENRKLTNKKEQEISKKCEEIIKRISN